MATVRSKYEVGNQAALIRSAFSGQNLEGLALAGGVHPARARGIGQTIPPSLLPNPTASWDLSNPIFSTTVTSTPPSEGSSILSNIINTAGDFITSRWGQQRGTITYNPDGTIVQKQAQGMPIQTSAPYIVGGTLPGQQSNALTGFALGGSSMMLLMGGAVLLIVLMSKK